VIVGSLSLRDHAERSFGFGQVMGAEFAALHGAPAARRQGRPAAQTSGSHSPSCWPSTRNCVAIYSVGAGNPGISAALQASGRAREIVFVGHELTPARARKTCSTEPWTRCSTRTPATRVRSALARGHLAHDPASRCMQTRNASASTST
jgi:hypothetical protein